MAEPTARIRTVELSDQKLVRFMIGKATMEPLAVANRRVYSNPFVLALWIGLSCIFVEYMNWWPKPEHGLFGYLAPVPAFGSLAIPLMFLSDWLNRFPFEDRSANILRRPDLADIVAYYSRSPASGFWLLEYGTRFVGLIAIDASTDSLSEETVAAKGRVNTSQGTNTDATIRHFYVEEAYRKTFIQNDLLAHAIAHAFSNDAAVQRIRAAESPLQRYIGDALREQGFQLEKKTERIGALRWQNSIRVLDRKRWKLSVNDTTSVGLKS
ncbi:hypothetical protein A0H81_00752 [Grifola frondosa]|uniref:N-acetyltransferase domain-containing protein n=1 Tax=Grifola frondosa TaxID=5627 RepID=A0A1C7MR45_GRIFR|nr:hypothetical protein A0H81_00752 [Grifola frondosa]